MDFKGTSSFDDNFMTSPETDPVNDGGDDLTSDITGLYLISFIRKVIWHGHWPVENVLPSE